MIHKFDRSMDFLIADSFTDVRAANAAGYVTSV